MKMLDKVYPTLRSEVAGVEEPIPLATASTAVVTMYDVYECLRNQLSTTAAYQPVFINGEAILPSSLVMMLEDGDAMLEARYEAERTPKSVALTITKVSKYDRAAIASTAHSYAKGMANKIPYRKRLATGFRIAWKEATDSNFEMNATHIVIGCTLISMNEIKAAERWLKRTFVGRAAFQYDTLYYSEKYHTRTGTIIPQYA